MRILRKKRRRSRLTLIELLVVMLIMGILMIMVLPAFINMFKTNEVDQMAAHIAAAIEQTRTQALNQRTHVALLLPSNRGAWPDLEEYCYGGFRMAVVEKNASTYEFKRWVNGSDWKNAPDGSAMLVGVTDSDLASSGGGLDYTKIALKVDKNFSDRLLPITNTPGGIPVANCALVFSPYGSLENGTTYLVISEALQSGNDIVYPTHDGSNNTTNYIVLKVHQFSGKVEYITL